MSDHFLENLKAYASLVGAVVTALLGVFTNGPVGEALTAIAAVATALTVWTVPNKAPQTPAKAPSGDVQGPTE